MKISVQLVLLNGQRSQIVEFESLESAFNDLAELTRDASIDGDHAIQAIVISFGENPMAIISIPKY